MIKSQIWMKKWCRQAMLKKNRSLGIQFFYALAIKKRAKNKIDYKNLN